MRFASVPMLLSCILLAIGAWGTACGRTVTCGPGTVEDRGICVPVKTEPTTTDAAEARPEQSPDQQTPPERRLPNVPPDANTEPSPERQTGDSNVGTARTGEACGPQRACLVGPCLREGYCTALCDKDDACPTGMKCREVNHQQSDGTFRTFLGCIRPPTEAKACTRAQDCPSHQACTTRISADGTKVDLLCTDAIPGGKRITEPCNSTKGIRCRNDLCLSDAFCSAICNQASDCPKDWACEAVSLTLPNGKNANVKACTPGKKTCGRDQDCPPGTVCRSYANKDQATLDFLCAPRNANGGKPGAACDKNDPQFGCYNEMCVDAGFCLAVCQEEKDCASGFTCNDIDATLPKGKFKFKGCVVKQTPCERNSDCPPELVCALTSNSAQDKITPVCALRRLHTQPAGKPCKAGTNQASNECSNHMCISDQYCSAICKEDKDCLKGYKCANLTVGLPNNPNAAVLGCIKE